MRIRYALYALMTGLWVMALGVGAYMVGREYYTPLVNVVLSTLAALWVVLYGLTDVRQLGIRSVTLMGASALGVAGSPHAMATIVGCISLHLMHVNAKEVLRIRALEKAALRVQVVHPTSSEFN